MELYTIGGIHAYRLRHKAQDGEKNAIVVSKTDLCCWRGGTLMRGKKIVYTIFGALHAFPTRGRQIYCHV